MQQTNTSDMLDLAVDYIKELQDEVKVSIKSKNLNFMDDSRQIWYTLDLNSSQSLSDNRTKCVCSNKQML